MTGTLVADDDVALDRLFQALADTTRRRMVEQLGQGPASVSELAKPFAMSLAAVVQHVQVLETAGLIRSEKVGRVRTCQMEPAAMRTVEQWVAQRRRGWEERFDRLGQLLAQETTGTGEGPGFDERTSTDEGRSTADESGSADERAGEQP